MSNLPLTLHAKQRRKQRGITERQIEEVLKAPDCTYHNDGATIYRRGTIVVVVNDHNGSIRTVVDRGDAST